MFEQFIYLFGSLSSHPPWMTQGRNNVDKFYLRINLLWCLIMIQLVLHPPPPTLHKKDFGIQGGRGRKECILFENQSPMAFTLYRT
jgi:hypothetical protein